MAAVLLASSLNGPTRAGLLVVACGAAVVGLTDDIVTLPASSRLVLQAAAAGAAIPWLVSHLGGPSLWVAAFTVGVGLWLVSYINAFNFMDGVHGMAMAQTVVAGVAWYVMGRTTSAPAFATIGLILAAAALGFAPFNVPRGRVFLGDVGSYFFGAALGAAAVVGLRSGIAPEAVFAPLALYLADTGSTIFRRARRGESLFAPHRDHAYQWLVRQGWSHGRTTVTVGSLIAVSSALGAVSLTGLTVFRVLADAAVLALLAAYCAIPTRMASRPMWRRITLRRVETDRVVDALDVGTPTQSHAVH